MVRSSRKALKNKRIIVELVDPHVCDASNLENITDAEDSKPVAKKEEARQPLPRMEFSDRRPKEHVKSTAPLGILEGIKLRTPSVPKHTLDDMEGGDDEV